MQIKDWDYIVTASGRVNIIGEHVDYCGGKVLPAALSLKNTVYLRPNGKNVINIEWTTLPERVTLDINRLGEYKNLKFGNYQAGSAFVWQESGHKVVGCDMLMDCKVPFGSGLSSSAAIEVSTLAALRTLSGEYASDVEIALLAQRAEREYVGMNCGIMDQYASACGKKNKAMLLNCKDVTCEYIPLELGDYELVIIDCRKPHNLVDSKYNERRAETEEAFRIMRKYEDIDCLADVTPEMFRKHEHALSGKVRDRARHVVEECERVRLAVQCMKDGRIDILGKLLNESHASLSRLYEVTGRELDALASIAQSHPACIGSRMTGAGFGGCTISLVQKDGVKDFTEYTLAKYTEETGYEARCYQAEVSDGITSEVVQ